MIFHTKKNIYRFPKNSHVRFWHLTFGIFPELTHHPFLHWYEMSQNKVQHITHSIPHECFFNQGGHLSRACNLNQHICIYLWCIHVLCMDVETVFKNKICIKVSVDFSLDSFDALAKNPTICFFLGHVSTHETKPTSLRTTWARFLHPSLPGARQHHEFEGKISLVKKKQPLSVSIYAIRWICSNCTKYINLNYMHPLFHQIYPENTENLES